MIEGTPAGFRAVRSADGAFDLYVRHAFAPVDVFFAFAADADEALSKMLREKRERLFARGAIISKTRGD